MVCSRFLGHNLSDLCRHFQYLAFQLVQQKLGGAFVPDSAVPVSLSVGSFKGKTTPEWSEAEAVSSGHAAAAVPDVVYQIGPDANGARG